MARVDYESDAPIAGDVEALECLGVHGRAPGAHDQARQVRQPLVGGGGRHQGHQGQPAGVAQAAPSWTEGPLFNDPLGDGSEQLAIRTRLIELTDAALPGSTELRKELVKDALDYLNNLTGQGSDDPGLLRTGKLFTLPDDTLVYPAHDYKQRRVSTIAQEKDRNERLGRQKTLEEFRRMHDQIRQAPVTSKQARDYLRVFLSGATDELPDPGADPIGHGRGQADDVGFPAFLGAVPADATAFAHRDARIMLTVYAIHVDPARKRQGIGRQAGIGPLAKTEFRPNPKTAPDCSGAVCRSAKQG